MPRPKKGEALSDTPRAKKERKERTIRIETEAASMAETTGDPEHSTEIIGVVDTPANEPELDVYTCGNCQAIVDLGNPACGVCEMEFNWEGLNVD